MLCLPFTAIGDVDVATKLEVEMSSSKIGARITAVEARLDAMKLRLVIKLGTFFTITSPALCTMPETS